MLTCPNCGSTTIYLKEKGAHKGVFCTMCDKWITWVGKKQLESEEFLKQVEASSVANLERFKREQAEKQVEQVETPVATQTAVDAVLAATDDLFKATAIVVGGQSVMVEHTETPAMTTTSYKHPDCKHYEYTDSLRVRIVNGNNVVYFGETAYVAPNGGYLDMKSDGLAVYDKNLCLAATFKRV